MTDRLCLRGFQCGNNDGNTCYAFVPTNAATVVQTGVCSGTNVVNVAQATLPVAMTITAATTVNKATSTVTITGRPEFTLWAPMFQINHQASDLEAAPKSSASSSATTSSTSSRSDPNAAGINSATGSSSPSTSASTDASNSGQGGLSTGAIAGIGVGAAIGVILLAALAGCVWWRRVRQSRQAAAEAAEALEAAVQGPSSYPDANDGSGRSGSYYAGELPTKDALYHMRPELENGRPAAELPAGGWYPTRV